MVLVLVTVEVVEDGAEAGQEGLRPAARTSLAWMHLKERSIVYQMDDWHGWALGLLLTI